MLAAFTFPENNTSIDIAARDTIRHVRYSLFSGWNSIKYLGKTSTCVEEFLTPLINRYNIMTIIVKNKIHYATFYGKFNIWHGTLCLEPSQSYHVYIKTMNGSFSRCNFSGWAII